VIVVIVLALWMISGLLMPSQDESESATESAVEKSPMTVRIEPVQNTLTERKITLKGQLEPVRHLQIKARTSGVVEQILVNKGDRVSASQALAQLELGDRSNNLAEAQSMVKTARSEQAAAQALRQQRLQSQLQLEQADAALEAALARLAGITLDIDYTTVTAPFAGIVNTLPIEQGALIDRGNTVAELIDTSAFKIRAMAAQTNVAQLKIGQQIDVDLITGQSLSGRISYISAIADPQSRTFAIEAVVDNPQASIAAGVSATISIPVESLEATFVSPSVLSLDDSGELGVKVVDAEDRVVFTPVKLISTKLDGAWVSGLKSGDRVITLGQGFVNTGDKVSPSLAEGN